MNPDERRRNEDYEWAVKLNRLTLNIIGIWPHVHQSTCDKFLSDLRVAFSLFMLIFIGMIPMWHLLVVTWGDILVTIDTLQVILPVLTSILKLMIIWRKKKDLTTVLDMMTKDWLKDTTERESGVMIKHAQIARAITIFGYTIMLFGFMLLVIVPCFGITFRYVTNVTNPDKLLPLPGYYIYDKDSSPYFEFTYIAQTIIALICMLSYTGVDTLMGLFVFHLCGQIENLRSKLENMEQWGDVSSGIAFVVKDHIRLIKCFNIIESTFTLLLLVLLLYFAILFCLYGFLTVHIATGENNLPFMRLIYLIPNIINMCGHMCLHCAVGEILVSQSEGISQAVYDSDWYRLKPNNARGLIMIMIRANRPLCITAGKMFPMTMSTFCSLIKTSAGYISVLLATQG